jgi:hypothetical protein
LIIEDGYWHHSPVYNFDKIYTLFKKMKREWLEANYLKRESARLKKQKVKALKHKAIIAKINQIAKEDKIKFRIIKYVKKVKLIIYLLGKSGREGLSVISYQLSVISYQLSVISCPNFAGVWQESSLAVPESVWQCHVKICYLSIEY